MKREFELGNRCTYVTFLYHTCNIPELKYWNTYNIMLRMSIHLFMQNWVIGLS